MGCATRPILTLADSGWDRPAEVYALYTNRYKRRFRWLSPRYIS